MAKRWTDKGIPHRVNSDDRKASASWRHPDRSKLEPEHLMSHTATKGCSPPVWGPGQGQEKHKPNRYRFRDDRPDGTYLDVDPIVPVEPRRKGYRLTRKPRPKAPHKR